MTDIANLVRHLPGSDLKPLQVIHEANQAEIVAVVNGMNELNEKLRVAEKSARPELLRAWWRLKSRYDYLKWAIEEYSE